MQSNEGHPMRDDFDLKSTSYTPSRLINETAWQLGCRNYHSLAFALEMDPAQLCRVRKRTEIVSNKMMIAIADRTGWSIHYIRSLAGMPFEGLAMLKPPSQKIGRTLHLYAEFV